MTALLFGVLEKAGGPSSMLGRLALLGAGAGFLVLFARRQALLLHPLVPPGLVLEKATAIPYLSATLMGIALYGVSTYVPLYVQGARGGTAGSAGAVVTPLILFWAVSATAGGRLILRVGFRRSAVLGGCLLVLGFAGLLAAVALDAVDRVDQRGLRRRRARPRADGALPAPRRAGGRARRAARRRDEPRPVLPHGRRLARRRARWAPSSRPASRRASGRRSNPRAGRSPGEIPAPPLFRLAMERSLLPVFGSLLAVAALAVFTAARFPPGRHRSG